MRQFILGVLLLPAVALAQPVTVEKPVICEDVKVLLPALVGNDYKEVPIWSGKDETSRYALLANEKTGSWTFIQYNKQIACILGVGENHSLVPKGPKS